MIAKVLMLTSPRSAPSPLGRQIHPSRLAIPTPDHRRLASNCSSHCVTPPAAPRTSHASPYAAVHAMQSHGGPDRIEQQYTLVEPHGAHKIGKE
jgi:hypothetical protein